MHAMDKPSARTVSVAAVWLLMAGLAHAAGSPCDDAWAAYNEFKSRSVMEPSQYPLSTEGAAVRAACGKDALPAPANADLPPRVRVRKPRPPTPPVTPKPALPGNGGMSTSAKP